MTSRREQGLNMQDTLNASYPVLPLRDIVVFPHMIVPLFVGREKSVHALEGFDRIFSLSRGIVDW